LLLSEIAAKDPERFLPLAEQMSVHDHEQIRQHLFRTLMEPQQSSNAAGQWQRDTLPRLGFPELVRVADLPAIHDHVWDQVVPSAIRHWPQAGWSRACIQRLMTMAETSTPKMYSQPNEIERAEMDWLNRADCRALEAVIALADRIREYRPAVWALCQKTAADQDLARRLQGVRGWWFLSEREADRSDLLAVFLAEPRLIALAECAQMFHWLAKDGSDQALLILDAALTHGDERVAENGGFLLGALRIDGLPLDERLDMICSAEPSIPTAARKGLAKAFGDLLTHYPVPEWLAEPLVRLAQHSRDVTWALISPFQDLKAHAHLIDQRDLAARLASSPAGRDHAELLIHGFDTLGDLTPVKEVILDLARTIAQAGPVEPIMQYHASTLTLQLTRLLEEAERRRDDDLKQRALDAVDGLIARGLPQVRTALEGFLVSGIAAT